MAKNKRLGVSVFVVILCILMVLSVIFTFSISYKFSRSDESGKLFGQYIYVMDSGNMEPEITEKSAVLCDDSSIAVLVEGNVILFKNGEREDVMRIRKVIHNSDSTLYHVSPDAAENEIIEIPKENVLAKCVEESHNLGVLISFLSGGFGIILGILLPCVVLLAVLVIKVMSMKKAASEEEYVDESDDDDDEEYQGFNGQKVRPIGSSPLFDPESDINPDDEFERKKSSIAKNFSLKPGASIKKPPRVRQHNEPKAAVEKFKAAVEEKPNVSVSRKSTLVPENENPVASEKLAAIKAALSHQDEESEQEYMTDNIQAEDTVSFKEPESLRVIQPSEKARVNPTHKKNDNINTIDDLIKILEEEKKKL